MKAICLTYDKNRALTNHMIVQYDRLWPDNPFRFRIPYQQLKGESSGKREYIKSPVSIKATVLRLLKDLEDEEWIYWCIDDKYPISLDIAQIKNILSWIGKIQDKEISGISFCPGSKPLNPEILKDVTISDNNNNIYFERKSYKQIWIHQFLRVKVIRHLLEHFPDEIKTAKIMDYLKDNLCLPQEHRLFISKKTMATFGESTSRGLLTHNCYKSMIKNGFALPEWFSGTNGKNMILDGMGRSRKARLSNCIRKFLGFRLTQH